ncbi:MAG: threonine synthase [Bacillota bacterium]|nr:MAG: threonine synthase [Bacillota bacterium]
MKFYSTRGGAVAKNASEAIVKGIAEDGGLFVPERFPDLSGAIEEMLDMDYADRAAFVLSKYLEEYDFDALSEACENAYALFDEDAAPVVKLDDNLYILELFHGPTLAFKDIALTLLPYLLRAGCDNAGIREDVMILTATSGDTGKAALEGFKNRKGVKIMVFYPDDGVAEMQRLQMCTTEGDNVNVVAVKGNFDDCQTTVKKIFTDEEFKKQLKEEGVIFSSANSMNFGRLSPQIAYYFSAYCDLVNAEEISLGDKIDFVVPTGNFGDILAGWYAKKMGLPVNKLICASNKNNVLTDFFETGVYDVNREFYKTMSPSMDILISSNLERLIFELDGRNAEATAEKMRSLAKTGKFSVSAAQAAVLKGEFSANFCSEEECAAVIGNFFDEYQYVLDPHTAVAMGVYDGYACENGEIPTVILSTASPYKFSQDVYKALTGKAESDAFVAAQKLEKESAEPVPKQIEELKSKPVRFTEKANKEDLKEIVLRFAAKK